MGKIEYEVYIKGTQNFIQKFESYFPYAENQDIFIDIDGQTKRLGIREITHNHLGEKPITRLNCVYKKYE